MSDEWRRPDGDEAPPPVPGATSSVDVPLSAADGESSDPDAGRPSTNWRRVIAVSTVGGVVLGVVLAVILLALDDGGDPAGAPFSPQPGETPENTRL